MIANLMTALLLALGVGTSNLNNESIDSFKQIEKPIQLTNTIEETNVRFQIDKGFTKQGSTYTYTQNNGSTIRNLTKHKINDSDSSSILTTDYLYIANTTYELNTLTNVNNGVIGEANCYQVYQIHNYFDSQLTITIDIQLKAVLDMGTTTENHIWVKQYDNLNSIIDLTLNASTMSTLNSKFYETAGTLVHTNNNVNNSEDTIISQVTITMNPNTQTGLLFRQYRVNDVGFDKLEPQAIQIIGLATRTYIQQEIVDIPNLMFTILTLPFSFYSTAFNLVIFPGTPYQINFGNIILTILAALILMYLIKKVLR